jgi:hypothetical protein
MDSFHLKPLQKKQFWGYKCNVIIQNDVKHEIARDIEYAFGAFN